jgi:TetR/AcrR family transcriptional regulator, repressor of the ameABC operon
MARPNTDMDAVRGQLLDLVEGIIQRRGATTVTLTELANEAGMSPANIYRFFDSKESLFEAVAERWFEPKIRIMDEVVASDLPPREKLYEFFARRFRLMQQNHEQDPVLFKSYCDLGHEHLEIVRGYLDLGDHYLAMIVAEAIEQGHFKGLTIDQSVSLINLMIQPFCNPGLMFDLVERLTEDKLKLVIATILDGMRGQSLSKLKLMAA